MEMKRIEKPWGSEEILEVNDKYVMKRLNMKQGHRCSLQYHEKKKETVYVVSGRLKILLGPSVEQLVEKIYLPQESVTIEPHEVHRMEAVDDCVYLEASTPELDDVVRLKDDYRRS